MKRVIGLIPLVDDARDSLWMLPGYMEGVAEAGGLPLMLPLTAEDAALDQLCGLCDAFLLTGGHDVSPALYGEQALPECGDTSPRRDAMELGVLRRAMALDKPVLGICRGIQFVNAALGGTLWQDLPSQHPSEVCHRQTPPYDVPAHPVAVLPDTPLSRLLNADAPRPCGTRDSASCGRFSGTRSSPGGPTPPPGRSFGRLFRPAAEAIPAHSGTFQSGSAPSPA